MLRFVVKGITDVLVTEESFEGIQAEMSGKFIKTSLYGTNKSVLVNVNEIVAVVDFEPPASEEIIVSGAV